MLNEEIKRLVEEYWSLGDDIAAKKTELKPYEDQIKALSEKKQNIRNTLINTVLSQTDGIDGKQEFENGGVKTHFDTTIEIRQTNLAVRAIIEYADKYKELTGQDIIGILLSISLTQLNPRIKNEPENFGLVNVGTENNPEWESGGFSVKRVKKVSITNEKPNPVV